MNIKIDIRLFRPFPATASTARIHYTYPPPAREYDSQHIISFISFFLTRFSCFFYPFIHFFLLLLFFFNNTHVAVAEIGSLYYTRGGKYRSELFSFTFPKFIPDVTEMLTDVLRSAGTAGANDKAFSR